MRRDEDAVYEAEYTIDSVLKLGRCLSASSEYKIMNEISQDVIDQAIGIQNQWKDRGFRTAADSATQSVYLRKYEEDF